MKLRGQIKQMRRRISEADDILNISNRKASKCKLKMWKKRKSSAGTKEMAVKIKKRLKNKEILKVC